MTLEELQSEAIFWTVTIGLPFTMGWVVGSFIYKVLGVLL